MPQTAILNRHPLKIPVSTVNYVSNCKSQFELIEDAYTKLVHGFCINQVIHFAEINITRHHNIE